MKRYSVWRDDGPGLNIATDLGGEWVKFDDVEGLITALKVIRTWASFPWKSCNDRQLILGDIADKCDEVLE